LVGRLEWIGLRPGYRATVVEVEHAVVRADRSLVGDHAALRGGTGRRNLTIVQAEHLEEVAALTGNAVRPEQLRRNLVVSGADLDALRHARFYVGAVLLEGTGACHPCSRMNETLGAGGFDAVRGRGGITARALSDGEISIGDIVRVAAGDSV
jgi:MOSC domain-containing protein YiiM